MVYFVDVGGQYDAVSVRNCGKEPFSGVDPSRHPGMIEYVEQAGNGLFCMRICEAGQQLEDPCNVKNDTAGCHATMGVVFREGFSLTDRITGESRTYSISLPPPRATNTPTIGTMGTTAVGSNTRIAGSVPTPVPNTGMESRGIVLLTLFMSILTIL
jgi:hypothetical protein